MRFPARRGRLVLAATSVFMALAGSVSADTICRFDTECFVGEGCDTTSYEIALDTALGDRSADPSALPASVPITDIAGQSTPLEWQPLGTALAGVATRDGTLLTLTIAPDNTGSLVITDPGAGLIMVYTGTCTP